MLKSHLVEYMAEDEIERVLKRYTNIAMVGASDNPDRPSYRVFKYMVEVGFNVIPVNPNTAQVLGIKTYPDLRSVPGTIEIVDIFRRSEDVMPIVDEAIKVGAKVIWMQQGIINEQAAEKAKTADIIVIMDRCIRTEYMLMNERDNWDKS
jgi:uncharacterized protein